MPHRSRNRAGLAPDEALLDAFHRAAVPREAWTHETHVRVAYLLLRGRPLDEGLAAIRSGIRALNAALGVEEGPESGYHETVTAAWARIIHDRAGDSASPDSQSFCAAHPELLDKRLLLRYYTRERIMSAEAKRGFVAPDVRALPR